VTVSCSRRTVLRGVILSYHVLIHWQLNCCCLQ